MPEGFRPPQGLKLTDTITRAGADSLRNQAFTLIDVAYERSPDFRRFPNCYDTNVTRVYNYFRGTVERVSTPYQNDHIDWNEGRVREGYADVPLRPTYAPVHQPAEPVGKLAGRRERLSIPAEERLGSLIAAIGTVWATYAATVDANLASRAGRGLCAGDSCVATREVAAVHKGKLTRGGSDVGTRPRDS
jgi:hypothetical protein